MGIVLNHIRIFEVTSVKCGSSSIILLLLVLQVFECASFLLNVDVSPQKEKETVNLIRI